jgi:hypothetical protein
LHPPLSPAIIVPIAPQPKEDTAVRMLLRAQLPVAKANAAIKDGTLSRVIQETVERIKPEAAYFTTVDGTRTALFIFDMTDSSQMPVIAEPFFLELDAAITFSPVMNGEDLQRGLKEAGH